MCKIMYMGTNNSAAVLYVCLQIFRLLWQCCVESLGLCWIHSPVLMYSWVHCDNILRNALLWHTPMAVIMMSWCCCDDHDVMADLLSWKCHDNVTVKLLWLQNILSSMSFKVNVNFLWWSKGVRPQLCIMIMLQLILFELLWWLLWLCTWSFRDERDGAAWNVSCVCVLRRTQICSCLHFSNAIPCGHWCTVKLFWMTTLWMIYFFTMLNWLLPHYN